MSEAPIADLRQTIRDLHGCESEWIEALYEMAQHLEAMDTRQQSSR